MKNKKIIRLEKVSYSYPAMEVMDDEWSDSGKKLQKKEEAVPADQTSPAEIMALDKVDLEVDEGQFICILGSNGSGKSTLARHLNALLCPTEGTVWIDGMKSSDEAEVWNIRSSVGMVFQNPDNQIIGSRVDEEVAFGLENMGVESGEICRRVENALETVGMTEFSQKDPGRLSGGQKQRVAVAGILAMRPKCIVLDESTAMLDPKGRNEIMNTVLQLNREYGITLICITHFMEEALSADRIFVMNRGRIVMSGNAKEIFSRGNAVEEFGLKLPVICRLAEKLRSLGLDVPADIVTEEELSDFLKPLLRQD